MLKLFLDPYPVMQMYSYSYINMQVAERLGERDHLVPLFGHLECDTFGARDTPAPQSVTAGSAGVGWSFSPQRKTKKTLGFTRFAGSAGSTYTYYMEGLFTDPLC